MTTAYLGLDAHASTCTLGLMDEEGRYRNEWTFPTSESTLTRHVSRIDADEKLLTLEETSLAFWIGRTLRDQVDEVLVCDPWENDLITSSAQKNDSVDAYNLCRLLRLGALKEVYHPIEDDRTIFKAAVDEYLDTRDRQRTLKQKLKAKFRRFGVLEVSGKKIYSESGRDRYLDQVEHARIREQLERLYQLLDAALDAQDEARQAMCEMGRRYPEIREFQKMPGVGPIVAHVFDGYIQTPHRFATRQKLWRYCQLGVRSKESGGKKVSGEQIDRAGHGELKNQSYFAWNGAMRMKEENEVRSFYEASLERTGSSTNARLNTQRKILAVLWTIWKKDRSYNPDRFLGSGSRS